MSNITQVVNTDKNMKTLKQGMHYSDLDQLLSSTGPFTFFAPSDLAFEKLGENFMTDLMTPEKKDALTDLLNNHILAGQIDFHDLKDGDKLTTINGRELFVTVKMNVPHVADMPITPRLQKISNGVIHSMEGVLGN
jgi:uncharacterized surface protein with fasciclin (FAS1) repeats